MDRHKLTHQDGAVPIPADFTFTPTDKLILRQFECGSEPCLLLSQFYQICDATSHKTLFVTAAYLSLMWDTCFAMYDDISHSDLKDLRTRKKTVYVVSSQHVLTEEHSGRNMQPMHPCIELFRQLYANDMARRCGLRDDAGLPTSKLPVETSIAALLNPLYGGKCLWAGFIMTTSNNS